LTLLVKTLKLRFRTPYHVGWRDAQPIIESFTVHRALIATLFNILEASKAQTLINAITSLHLSSLLPLVKTTIRGRECYTLLTPIPRLPSSIELKKVGVEWATIGAALELVKSLSECRDAIENAIIDFRAITSRGDCGKVKVLCGGRELELNVTRSTVKPNVLTLVGEEISETVDGRGAPFSPFERVVVWRNRVDRVTGATDLYRVSGYRARGYLALVLVGNTAGLDVESLLKIIGALGLGGLRSYGFGRFEVEGEVEVCVGMDKIDRLVATQGKGLLLSLGAYCCPENLELKRSFVRHVEILGYSGPSYAEHLLPYMVCAGAGSLLYFKGGIGKACRYDVELPGSVIPCSYLIFNPVLLQPGGGGS